MSVTYQPPPPGYPPAPRPRPRRLPLVIGSVVIAVVLVLILAVVLMNSDGSDSAGAEEICEQFVTERLKSPSTADFPGAAHVSNLGGNKYEVTASVDSQNGFGAMIRTEYVCTVQDNDDGTWTLESLTID